jgi:hypothetical protein
MYKLYSFNIRKISPRLYENQINIYSGVKNNLRNDVISSKCYHNEL